MVPVTDESEKFTGQKEKNQSLEGIFEHEQFGILLIKPPLGELLLPGGATQQTVEEHNPQTHIQSEIANLQKLIFKQSGWLLDIAGDGRFCLYHDENVRQQIKVFLLKQSEMPIVPDGWERDLSYGVCYVKPEIEAIDALQNLNSRDKIILTDYLKNKKVTVRWPVCSVRNIA